MLGMMLASRMAGRGMRGGMGRGLATEASRTYLLRLRERLGLPEQDAAEIDVLASS